MARNKASDGSRSTLSAFALEFTRCAACWETQCWKGMHIHHLVGGAGRKHDRRNLLRLCGNCHDCLHQGPPAGQPDLTKGMMLWCKQQEDPEYYDPVFLAGLVHRKWLGYDPEPLDEWYISRRK